MNATSRRTEPTSLRMNQGGFWFCRNGLPITGTMSIFRVLVSMVAENTEKKWRTQISADVVIKDLWVTCNRGVSWLVKAMAFICFSVQCECKHKPSCDCDECWPQIYRGTLLPNPLLASRGFMLCFFRYQQCAQLFCFSFVTDVFEHDSVVWPALSSVTPQLRHHVPTPLSTVKNTNKLINFINFYFPEKRHFTRTLHVCAQTYSYKYI